MIILDKRKYERIVSELIDAKDIRELAERFSLDRVYYYHILKDISSGQRSPNYKLLKSVAARRKLSEDFVIEQAKSVLNFFIPYYQSFQPESLDYYKVLNVPRNASDEEIRRSWIELMKSHHPDKAGAEGLDTSKKINEAYEVLSNSAKREAYDNKHLPPTPVIVPQNEMRKYYYAASLMVVVFLAVMYASGSGLIFESTEEKERLAREIEAPELPNTVYKGDLVDTEKVDKRISEIKPIEPGKPAGDAINAAEDGKDSKTSVEPVVTAPETPEKPDESKSAEADQSSEAKTEIAGAGTEDASLQAGTDTARIAPSEGAEAVSADNADITAPVEEPDKAIEITEVTIEEKEEKTASAQADNAKDKTQAKTGDEASEPETKEEIKDEEIKDKDEKQESLKVADASLEKPAAEETKEVSSGKDSSQGDAEIESPEKEAAPEAGLAAKTEEPAEKKGEVTEITMPEPEKKPADGEYYTVRKGDSLWSIAHKFDTTTDELSRLNGLGNNKIDIGDKLLISGEGVPVVKPKPEIAAAEKKQEKAGPAPVDPAGKVKLPEPLITEVEKPAKQPVKSDITEDFDPKIATSAVAIRDTSRSAPEPIPPAVAPPDRNSVYVFVSSYVAAYKNRDIDRVKALFAPDAVENGVGIAKVLNTYSSNFSKLDIVSYEVKVNRVSLQNTLGLVRGDFYITFKDQRTGVLKSSRGNINWRLFWSDGGWKIQELTYRIEHTDTVGG
ncbi:MAG: DnaJ domain-containing protein [Thermodesulfobacteriota bacterium]